MHRGAVLLDHWAPGDRGERTAQSMDTATDQCALTQNTTRLERVAHYGIDLSLLSMFYLAPLVLGGRHPVGKLVLVVLAVPGTIGLTIKIFSGKVLPLSHLHLLVLAGCLAIPLLQIAPVSPASVRNAAPGFEKLLSEEPGLAAGAELRNTFSVSAVTTEKTLPLIVCYLCIFVFLACRLETLEDVEWLFTLLVGSALMLTVLALLQSNFGNGRFLWFYDHPSRVPGNIPRGPFQNENHLSSLLATLLPCAMYFLFQPSPYRSVGCVSGSIGGTSSLLSETRLSKLTIRLNGQGRRWTAAIACGVIIITVYATPSRGGAAMIGFAAAVWLSAVAWSWVGRRYMRRMGHGVWMQCGIGVGGLASLVGVGALFWVAEKYSYARAKLWAADYAIWKDFPLLGIGAGNHRHVYRAYLPEYFPDTFSTAESSVLQLLVETGAVGIALLIVVLGIVISAVLRTVAQTDRGSILLLGCALLAGLAASCIHATGDFPWHIPACFVVVIALVACAIRLPAIIHPRSASSDSARWQVSPAMSVMVVSMLVGGNLWAVVQTLPDAQASLHWDAYRRLLRDSSGPDGDVDNRIAIRLLCETLRCDPYHVQARTKLVYRMMSELEQKRSRLEECGPLAREVLKQAAVLAKQVPTEARAYLCATVATAALGSAPEQQREFLKQAGRLRLVDGQISLRLGMLALVLQDEREANEHFQRALNTDPSYRKHALRMLLLLYTPQQVLDRFELTLDSVAEFYQISLDGDDPQQRLAVGRCYCQHLWDRAAQGGESAEMDGHLLSAFRVAEQIGDDDWRMRLVSKRLELFPHSVELLLTRAKMSRRTGALQSARQDLERCLRIAPHDGRVRRLALQMDRDSRAVLR